MRRPDLSAERLDVEWSRLRLGIQLLLERRAGIFFSFNVLLLMVVPVAILAGGELPDLYLLALTPLVVPGLLLLSEAVALERRAGSLDLALTSPGAEFYFERRILSLLAYFAAQACLIVLVARLALARFPVLPVIIQALLSCALVGAVVLYWASRLRTSEMVALASLVTILLLSPWLGASPIPESTEIPAGMWLDLEGTLDWARTNAVLGGAALAAYLYARRRLNRPETMIQ